MHVSRRTDLILDLSISVALTVAMAAEQVRLDTTTTVPPVVSFALVVVIGGSLAFRRRFPLVSYIVGTAALIALSLLADPGSIAPYANLVGLFSLGTYGSRRHALWGPVILIPGVLAYFFDSKQPFGPLTFSVFGLWLASWAIGFQMARGREHSLLAREASRREAMADERVRIARELHDVVGHAVNLMLVQVGASRLIVDSDPSKAKSMLGDVENTARQALGELDQLLGLLRDDTDPATQLGLGDLPTLRERLAGVGLAVELVVEPRSFPPQVDVVVYRIVQEALTNALRHGKASKARVRVQGGERVVIDISDNGHGPADYQPGRGLRGMAERVAVFGGSLEHHRDADGFHVHAELVLT